MTRAKFAKSAPLAKFGLDHVYGDYDRARQPEAAAKPAPQAARPPRGYIRGPFYLKIEGLTGPRPTSEELSAGKGWK